MKRLSEHGVLVQLSGDEYDCLSMIEHRLREHFNVELLEFLVAVLRQLEKAEPGATTLFTMHVLHSSELKVGGKPPPNN